MTARKRYSDQAARRLLAQLVEVADPPADIEQAPKRLRNAYIKRCRAALTELLTFRFGDVQVDTDVVTRLREKDGGSVFVAATVLRDVLRENNLTRSPEPSHPFTNDARGISRFPTISMTAFPTASGYRFEVGPSEARQDHGWSTVAFDQGAIRLQTLRLLEAVGRANLRGCACGRVFVRRGRRDFCSDRCQKRTYMRKYRAGDVGNGEESNGTTRKG